MPGIQLSSLRMWGVSGSSDIYIVGISERESASRCRSRSEMSIQNPGLYKTDADFRCPKHVLHPAISRAKIDTCYLDTTYLNPKYCFPPQPQVIEACAQLARRTVVGLSENAPELVDEKSDVKPDVYGEAEWQAEKGKEMMQGWLVKDEGVKTEVKEEEGPGSGVVGVKREPGEEGVDEEEKLVEIKPKKKGRTLVVMGTYSIGKERIVKGESEFVPAAVT
jgi:DNA cross-link repair 1A protein